jgi:hypothetical protein
MNLRRVQLPSESCQCKPAGALSPRALIYLGGFGTNKKSRSTGAPSSAFALPRVLCAGRLREPDIDHAAELA